MFFITLAFDFHGAIHKSPHSKTLALSLFLKNGIAPNELPFDLFWPLNSFSPKAMFGPFFFSLLTHFSFKSPIIPLAHLFLLISLRHINLFAIDP